MDGQHDSLILDFKSREILEGVCRKQSVEIAQIAEKVEIKWKYCPTERNLADLESRGVSFSKMELNEWYKGPQWLLTKKDWPPQPSIK